MAYDAPYRVERDTRIQGGNATVTSYTIMRSLEKLCWVDDVTFAYRLVDLLNEDENGKDIHR